MQTETVPQQDDIQYRDYLLAILDELYKPALTPEFGKEIFTKVSTPLTPKQLRQKLLSGLKNQFKQDFGTQDNKAIGANVVAIDVVKSVLQEDLGMAANNIPAQGAIPDREFLDQLITLSNQTSQALSVTYRIDLSSQDTDSTSRVRENILTLQSYMRDGKFQGIHPFFLYKREWQLQSNQSFFPENNYAFKTGLFTTEQDRNRTQELISAIKNHKDYIANRTVDRMHVFLTLDYHLCDGHKHFSGEEYNLAKSSYAGVKNDILQLISMMQMSVYSKTLNTSWTPSLMSPGEFVNSLDPRKYFGRPASEELYGDGLNLNTMKGSQPVDIPKKIPPGYPYTTTLFQEIESRYKNRAALKVSSIAELQALEATNTVSVNDFDPSASFDTLNTALDDLHDALLSVLIHIKFLQLPVCFGDLALASGNYPEAAYWYAQVGKEQLLRASMQTPTPYYPNSLEPQGDLPWNWRLDKIKAEGIDYSYLNQDCEVPFLQLRLGDLYLTWADQLYRVDAEPEVYRARELYKAVLRLYGLDPLPGEGLKPLPLHLERNSLPDRFGAMAKYDPTTILTWTGTGGIINAVPVPPPGGTGGFQPVAEDRMEVLEIPLRPPLLRRLGIGGQSFPDAQLEIATRRLAAEVKELPSSALVAWEPLIRANLSPEQISRPETTLAFSMGFSGTLLDVLLLINPAILAQQMRARIGITQIDAGLNFFGYSNDLVPLLRYRPLIAAANHFTALAKQAQSDFLNYKEHAENAEISLLQAHTALATAAIRIQVESQRILAAHDYIQQSAYQVQQVKDAIAAKKKEIADHDSFCGQVGDFFSGLKSFFGVVPDQASSYIKSDFSAAFGFGSSAGSTAVAGLGVVGGIALFGVAAGVTFSGMADQANQRVDDLKKLQTGQLPVAMALLDARERELNIAQLQKAVATLETLAAQEMFSFLSLRTLNYELWSRLSAVIKSTLHRYLDLGAMLGWLAERALCYEQARDLRLVRLDYFMPQLQGLLGADALQLDLANLEKEHLTGHQQEIPIKWTISLARDFPLQYGQLKTRGKCEFMTSSLPLDLAYPGTYAHRIKTVQVATTVQLTDLPPRGLLFNPGISRMQGAKNGETQLLVRPPDVFPLSEYTIQGDQAVYSLPDETLLPFEGSGVDALWRLELPSEANLKGLDSLADLTITFYLQARFSPSRKAELMNAGVPTLRRTLIISAKQLYHQKLIDFKTNNYPARFTFDNIAASLPRNENNRLVTNVAIYFVGEKLPELRGRLASDAVPNAARFVTVNQLAHSNLLPQPASFIPPAAKLDALVAGAPEQSWKLSLAANDNPGLQRQDIQDILLALEYTFQPSWDA